MIYTLWYQKRFWENHIICQLKVFVIGVTYHRPFLLFLSPFFSSFFQHNRFFFFAPSSKYLVISKDSYLYSVKIGVKKNLEFVES